nr:AbrB family transcriptional regulator [uncultured Anaeromusa sp.]
MKLFCIAETLSVASLGGFLFSLLHMPLPWMLGALAAVLLWNSAAKRPICWPPYACYAGLLLIGYAIGCTFTSETARQILEQLPLITLATITVTAFSTWQGYRFHKKTSVNLPSSLLGSIPGGLSQMPVLSREIPGADITIVTLMQAMRQLSVVFFVPFLAIQGLSDSSALTPAVPALTAQPIPITQELLLGSLVVASGFLGRFLKFPTPFLLGAVLATSTWVLAGLPAPQPSRDWLNTAQLCVGTYTGARIQLKNLQSLRKSLPYAFLSVVCLLAVSSSLSLLLAYFFDIPLLTAFLSTAPGGMAEMGLTAMMVHADMAVVVAFQLFRLLFILTVVPPILKHLIRREKSRQALQRKKVELQL